MELDWTKSSGLMFIQKRFFFFCLVAFRLSFARLSWWRFEARCFCSDVIGPACLGGFSGRMGPDGASAVAAAMTASTRKKSPKSPGDPTTIKGLGNHTTTSRFPPPTDPIHTHNPDPGGGAMPSPINPHYPVPTYRFVIAPLSLECLFCLYLRPFPSCAPSNASSPLSMPSCPPLPQRVFFTRPSSGAKPSLDLFPSFARVYPNRGWIKVSRIHKWGFSKLFFFRALCKGLLLWKALLIDK